MTWGGPGWIEVGFMSAHKSPHQAPARSNARHGGWKLQGGFCHRFGGGRGREGGRVAGHTNEAAWFQLFSKLNTGGVGLYGRSSEFHRYCTGWRIWRWRERVETARCYCISLRGLRRMSCSYLWLIPAAGMNMRKRRVSSLYCFHVGETFGNLPWPVFYIVVVCSLKIRSYKIDFTIFLHSEVHDKLTVDICLFRFTYVYKSFILLSIISVHLYIRVKILFLLSTSIRSFEILLYALK